MDSIVTYPLKDKSLLPEIKRESGGSGMHLFPPVQKLV
jgi:hypothetical protein